MEHIEEAITPEFLSGILAESVKSIKVSTGSNPGDNYMCVMYSIKATLETGAERSLILKAYPVQSARQQMLQVTNIFQKEFVVYDYWFPKYRKLQEEVGLSPLAVPPYLGGAAVDHDNNQLIPTENTPENSSAKTTNNNVFDNYLLMEDVRKIGYRMADRIKGLDVDHCRLVLRELGTLHAYSWVYKKKNGITRLVEKYPYLEDSMMSKKELIDSFQSVFDMIVGSATKMVEESLGTESTAYKNFVELFKQDTMEIMRWFLSSEGVDIDKVEEKLRVKTQFPKGYVQDPWLVLAHGDCWVNNFLFRYGEEVDGGTSKPVDIMLVDFQLFRESCPTTDLAYFLFTSTTRATRNAHLEELLSTYYESFRGTCEKFGIEPLPGFTLENLKIRFRQSKLYGILIALPLLFAVLKKAEGATDLDKQEYDNIGEIFEKGMGLQDENAILRDRLTELVQDFYEDGVL